MAYLHLGRDIVVSTKNIIGIFDLDSSTHSHHTREFLKQADRERKVFPVSDELPKSAIVLKTQSETEVYISQISPQTLLKRTNVKRRRGL